MFRVYAPVMACVLTLVQQKTGGCWADRDNKDYYSLHVHTFWQVLCHLLQCSIFSIMVECPGKIVPGGKWVCVYPPLPGCTTLFLLCGMMFGDPLSYGSWNMKINVICKLPPVSYCLHYWSYILLIKGCIWGRDTMLHFTTVGNTNSKPVTWLVCHIAMCQTTINTTLNDHYITATGSNPGTCV